MNRFLVPAVLVVATLFGARGAEASPRNLLQLVDYVGVDYSAAVEDGRVASEAEYAEMVEFSARIAELVAELPEAPSRGEILSVARTLSASILDKAEVGHVREHTKRLRDLVLGSYPMPVVPAAAPDLERGAVLYSESCAVCHGASGAGDGSAAAHLDPPPTSFRDRERALERSVLGLYHTITLGVEGTAMPPFEFLSEPDRWALAFHVGSLYASDEELARGEVSLAGRSDGGGPSGTALTLGDVTTRTPSEIAGWGGPEGLARMAYLRRHPEVVARAKVDPFAIARGRLEESLAAYRSGELERAYELAVAAYLDGFELAEAGLRALDAGAVLEIENAMLDYRGRVRSGAPAGEVESVAEDVLAKLETARGRLGEGGISGSVAFLSSLVILGREGLEAILLVAAIGAFLAKTGRREAMRYVHAGWILALLAGVATWFVSRTLFQIGGATREITEGVTALVAAAVLLYVGFWMHGHLNAERWQRFLREKVEAALDARTLGTLAVVSFLAVYREVFETVLFYQALWPQVEASSRGLVLAGAGSAILALALVAWAVFRFGIRLPFRVFFGTSGIIMLVLAVVFAGKGVAALQEADQISSSPIPFPRIDLLGIYPNLESLGLQLAVVVLGAVLVAYNLRSATVRSGAGSNAPARAR